MQYRQICEKIETTKIHKVMKKAEVMSVTPVACLVRGSVGRPPSGHTGDSASLQHEAEFLPHATPTSPHNANIINNNVDMNGVENGLVLSNNNNNNNNNNNKTSSSDRGTTRKKSLDAKGREQGSMGYVSERVRALSVSNRSKISSGQRFGAADLRASYNERLRSGPTSLQPITRGNRFRSGQEVGGGFVYMRGTAGLGGLYRSNSSLDLDHDGEEQPPGSPLRREYGSHGSINVASAPPETLYSILRNLKPTDPTKVASSSTDNVAGSTPSEVEATSPKARSKFQKLWDKDKPSIFKKLRSSKSTESKADSKSDINSESSVPTSASKSAKSGEMNGDSDSRSDDSPATVPARRSAFAHYDCRSMATQFNLTQMRLLLSERANTTTGASAAAMAGQGPGPGPGGQDHDSTEDLRLDDHDPGDGRSNHLINSCPFFRNELGGEGERVVSLSRDWGCGGRSSCLTPPAAVLHRPVAAATLGLLEPPPGQSHWRLTLCPYVRSPLTIEAVDQGSTYYRNYFNGQEHQNWFGVDDTLGPVAVSVRREKVEETLDSAHSLPTYQLRIIVRTSELWSCQGMVLEESLGRVGGEKGRGPGVREALEYVCPQLSVGCLRLGQAGAHTEEALTRLDDLGVHNKFKVGVLYCRAGQTTEEEMYNNEIAGPAFSEFLEMLGQRVRLKDFDKYRGGLDKKTDSTGLYSVYNQYREAEVMFHVSTLLPFTPNNRKQLLRKRHIGNDIVTIIFQEPGAPPFSPRHIRSHFQHVFIVVQAFNPCTENTQYRVTVSRFRDVPLFGPMMPEGATFPKSKAFTDFLLAKAINGEIAALRSEKFAAMATRTRHEYLKDLALNHSSSTTLDTSTKFSLMGFSRGGKKDKRGIKYIPDTLVRGALSWPLTLHDAALQQNVECVVGVSVDSVVVVVEDATAAVVFAAPCKSVIGWTIKPQQGLRIFYHQGECLLLQMRPGTPEADGDEALSEVVARLAAVTQGSLTQELVLRRNPAGLLGFNVQQDGVITEVEPYGLASQSGLRQGARLVEICTVTLATLSQEQMVDLLKTSMTVTVTVVPPHPDGAPRRGCNVPTCGFLLGGGEGDYENLTTPEQLSRKHRKSHHAHRYDRSLSPPRSSSSSGYGTGNSSRSFTADHQRHHHDPPRTHHLTSDHTQDRHDNQNNNTATTTTTATTSTTTSTSTTGDYDGGGEYERGGDYATGTLSSTSSGHSSDRWIEPLEEPSESPPPPLPARSTHSTKRRGDLFQSSFHNRGGPATPLSPTQHPVYTQPSPAQPTQPPISLSSSSPPPPFTHNSTYSHPSIGYTNPPTPVNPPTSSSSSPTPHPQGPGNQWHHHHYHPHHHHHHHHPRLDTDSDNGNYAVPPSHPRPLHATPEEPSPHQTGLGDYDNAPLRGSEGPRSRQTLDHISAPVPASPNSTTTNSKNNITPGQVSEYIAWRTERLNGNVRSSSLPGHLPRPPAPLAPPVQEDPAPASSLERLHPTRSEDELSGSSGSPHTNRHGKGGNVTPSSTSSRNQSPRTVAAEARLRQAAGPRKANQRNSANLGSSNLQEELFRLINPDYISDTESMASHENSERPRAYSMGVGAQQATQGSRINSSSLECTQGEGSVDKLTPPQLHPTNTAKPLTSQSQGPSPALGYMSLPPGLQQPHPTIVSAGPHNPPDSGHSAPQTEVAEVVVLTARPATVISNSSTSSPAPAQEHKVARGYPQDKPQQPSTQDSKWLDAAAEDKSVVECVGQEKVTGTGLDVDQEWMSLVNTATQAIQKSGDVLSSKPQPPSLPPQGSWPTQPPPSTRTVESSSVPPDPSNLHDRVAQLERRLVAEQQRSEQLEDEVTQLRTENRKLQEDSRAAAQQLHQFTEWFFNTIDKT